MIEIIMPKMGDAMTEGKVVRWYKQPGDAVKKGEAVVEIETDKVNLDLEAEGEGALSQHAAAEGATIPVGGLLAKILGPGESAGNLEAAPARAAKPAPEAKAAAKPMAAAQAPAVSGDRKRSSPLARRIAGELGVDIARVQGSGPHGRVVAEDVRSARKGGTAGAGVPAATAPAAAFAPALEARTIPLTAMRRTIAKRLGESTGPIPHFYLTADYDVVHLVAMRQQLIDLSGAKVSLNDFIVRAVALALRHHPAVNSSWGEDAISQHGEVHVGVAVATADGLITPVIRDADRKSVLDIAAEVRSLADKAKNRRLKPDEYQGSTFTISNLGAWGIEEFTAIINPPNVAILAVGAAEPRAVVAGGQVVVRDRMKVTLSCDHRVVDGATGAEFLKTLRTYVEQPLRLVM